MSDDVPQPVAKPKTKRNPPGKGRFRRDKAAAREAGRKGGAVTNEIRRIRSLLRHGKPYQGSILDVMDAAGLVGESWAKWRVVAKAQYALPMTEEELEVFRFHTGRDKPPEAPVAEFVGVMGRRSGKTRFEGGAQIPFEAMAFDRSILAPGESAKIPVIAADRKQARALLGYIKGTFDMQAFREWVLRTTKDGVVLKNGVEIEVMTASFRTIRGYTCPVVCCDELAFWYSDEQSANPDHEIVNAARATQGTVRNRRFIMISSPYGRRGVLFEMDERFYGTDDPDVLVWNASTQAMNPSVSKRLIERAFEEDPLAAASEYGSDGRVTFRRDVEAFMDPEAVRACTMWDRRELPPVPGVSYAVFTDPSGGSQDSFTIAIAHRDGDRIVLDCVRERRPPFSPAEVVAEFAALMRTYNVVRVRGDRYGAAWVAERFREQGVVYEHSEKPKSDLYREFIGPVNAGTVELLDHPALRAQLVGLERRVARGGRDSIDHAPRQRDDIANAVAGVCTMLATDYQRRVIFGGR